MNFPSQASDTKNPHAAAVNRIPPYDHSKTRRITIQESRTSKSLYDNSIGDGEVPPFERPIITYAILGVLVGIYVAMYLAGHGEVGRVAVQFGAKDNALIHSGQYWRLVTPIFLHGSLWHLLINGLSLYTFGSSMERIFGRRKFLIIFLLSGVSGNVLSLLMSPSLSLGASGALFGLVGAGLVFPIRFRNRIPAAARSSILRQLSTVTILNLAIGFAFQGVIDNSAHIGGLVGGMITAVFLLPEALRTEEQRPWEAFGVNAAVAALGVMVILSWVLQWRSSTSSNEPPTFVATSSGSKAWWAVNMPLGWKRHLNIWRGPSGCIVRLGDRALTQEDATEILTRKRQFNLLVDRKPAIFTTRPNCLSCSVPVDTRLFELTIEAPNRNVSIAEREEFQRMVGSIRFVRPPAEEPLDRFGAVQ